MSTSAETPREHALYAEGYRDARDGVINKTKEADSHFYREGIRELAMDKLIGSI